MRLSYDQFFFMVVLASSCIKKKVIQTSEYWKQCKIQLPVDVYVSHVLVVLYQSRVCSLAKVSLLFSLLSFLMAANTIVDDIPTLAYSLPSFLLTKPALIIKGEKSQKSVSRPPSWKSQVT